MRVGILGGGQLARMMAEAGGPLGLSFTFLDPSAQACAKDLGSLQIGAWDDADALKILSASDRITADFENVPSTVLAQLSAKTIVRPPASAFAAAQDRLTEKQLLEKLGIPIAPIAAVSSRPDLMAAVEKIGFPAVLKTRRLGYDGKGQAVLRTQEDLEPAWRDLGGQDLILEGWINFDFECAQTAVRSADGEIRCYPLTRTVHHDGVLRLAKSPAAVPAGLAEEAKQAVTDLLQALDYVGCLTLELFASGSEIIANEFAPRPHNSAHWTIEGAVTSQFENHLRAVCDLPLGATSARGVALMFNWLGSMPDRYAMLAVPGLCWHDYHKQSRPGRKVGHATLVAENEDSLDHALGLLTPLLDRQTAKLIATVQK
ncbi:MAG: 5-(carboxyamino)imidazole ribonucleotide synthase [Wenzhouxiangella sp.]|jgi:5-(carboxyamino)imidazole ribonucleotide synthase|nr:5-(carboxyamino)imidazole ribonucleotide synthase [Wenzhouxiangella sp.]